MNRDEVAVQRWLILGLALSITAVAATRLLAIFRVDGVSLLEVALISVFALLFALIAISFWVACLGAHALWTGSLDLPLREPQEAAVASGAGRPRTALLVPVYNENVVEVFARIQAIRESLRETGAETGFDFFVLSDSTDAECRIAEEASWRRARDADKGIRIFYRHRAENIGHKSGNIADFCRNWGAMYDYMVVLDADSLMTGSMLAHLVLLMDANPRTALIQVAPLLVGGQSLFARSQQFASWAYGRMFAAGLARLQGPDGNYWGHNAIIRVRPFMENCGLPILAGRPPLGGEIMSHDFVEAALLRRAGWEVWMAPELDGSYEASPPTLIDHLKRDRRWCQGNLQHIKLLFAKGLRMPSRLHMAFGALSYLSAPLWLMLIVLFSAHSVQIDHSPVTYIGRYPVLAWPISHTVAFVSIIAAAMMLLYAPKIVALVVLLHDREATRQHGGAGNLVLSVFIESVLSTLVAPVFMLSHSWFVLNILVGRNTRWGAQLRRGNTGLANAVAAFAPHSVIAIGAGYLTWTWTPSTFWWYLPLLAGMATAILFGWLTSLTSWGAAARRAGMFLVPSETTGLPIVDRVDALVAERDPSKIAMGENYRRRNSADCLVASL
jgi:membrane glycosyltransferase